MTRINGPQRVPLSKHTQGNAGPLDKPRADVQNSFLPTEYLAGFMLKRLLFILVVKGEGKEAVPKQPCLVLFSITTWRSEPARLNVSNAISWLEHKTDCDT